VRRDDGADGQLDKRGFMKQPTIDLCAVTCAELP
jgi:hypothetical protein